MIATELNKITLEAEIVTNILEKHGKEMRRIDILNAVGDNIAWTKNLGAHFQRLRERNENIHSTRRGYYIYRKYADKQPVPPVPQADIIAPAEESQKLLQTFNREVATMTTVPVPALSSQRPAYKAKCKIGDVLEVRVSGIESFGVFVEDWKNSISGLLHRSEIRDGELLEYNELLREFAIGMVLQVKVVSIRTRDGRIAFSIRAIKSKPPMPETIEQPSVLGNVLAEKLSAALQEKPIVLVPDPEPQPESPQPVQMAVQLESVEVKQRGALKVDMDHVEEISKVVRAQVGVMSLAAKNKLMQMVDELGIIRVSMALGLTAQDFKVDVSAMFMDEIEKKARAYL